MCELNKNPKDMSDEKVVSARAACVDDDESCIDTRRDNIKSVRKAFSRYDCESKLPSHLDGKDKSRVIVYHQLEPTENSNRALYKLDLHQMYVVFLEHPLEHQKYQHSKLFMIFLRIISLKLGEK